MRLVDYLNLIRERLLVVTVVIVLATVTAVGLNLLRDPVHSASVRMRARPPAPLSTAQPVLEEGAELSDLGTEAELVKSSAVAVEVAEATGFAGDPDDLLDAISVGVLANTSVLVVQADAATPEDAVILANLFAEKYIEVRRDAVQTILDAESDKLSTRLRETLEHLAELDRIIAQLPPDSTDRVATELEREQTLSDLVVIRSRLTAISDRAAIDLAGFAEIIQPARSASEVRSTSVPRSVVFGLLIGVPLSLAIVLLLDALSTRLRNRGDAERETRAEVLGAIPLDRRWTDPRQPVLAVHSDPFSLTAEAYRTLAITVGRYTGAANASTVLVTSPGDGDGKSATAANLGVALADLGHRVRVVDCDLRHPRVHRFFDAQPAPGTSDVLDGRVDVVEAAQELGPAFELLAAGHTADRPDLLLNSGEVATLFTTLSGRGGRRRRIPIGAEEPGRIPPHGTITLIDSPSVLEAAEVSTLAAHADATLLVVRVGQTSRQAAARAADQIRRAGGYLLGVVLVGVRSESEVGGGSLSDVPVGASGTAPAGAGAP